jgi:GTPase
MSEQIPMTRCGYVAIIGPPNAGKSTLMNAVIGERLSIVTPKPHTTRTRVLGIITDPNRHTQVIFLDTPGIVKQPRYRLQDAMGKQIGRGLKEADIVLALYDFGRGDAEVINLTREVAESGQVPVIHVLNKIDLAGEREIDMYPWPEGTIKISALAQLGLNDLGEAIRNSLPVGPYLYPEDTLADQPERFFVAELIRETIFDRMKKEIPYTTAVMIDDFIERKPKDFIRVTILVDHDSQKGIMIGKQGAALRDIGRISRDKIEAFLGRGVFLELFVKVKKDWMKKDADLRDLGYLES